ncbi:hypothetical protein D3C76_1571520 [compost metagenome]
MPLSATDEFPLPPEHALKTIKERRELAASIFLAVIIGFMKLHSFRIIEIKHRRVEKYARYRILPQGDPVIPTGPTGAGKADDGR